MSDGPTHFKYETILPLTKGLRVSHHFKFPYTPWGNGAIKRLGGKLLEVFRSILSELHMRPEEWMDLLPIFQSALNNAPSPQRLSVLPVTAFTGLQPTPLILAFIQSSTSASVTVTDVQRKRMFNIQSLKQKNCRASSCSTRLTRVVAQTSAWCRFTWRASKVLRRLFCSFRTRLFYLRRKGISSLTRSMSCSENDKRLRLPIRRPSQRAARRCTRYTVEILQWFFIECWSGYFSRHSFRNKHTCTASYVPNRQRQRLDGTSLLVWTARIGRYNGTRVED